MKRFLQFALVFLSAFALSMPVKAETITIVGTGDGVNVLKSIGEAFSKANPGISVDVPKSIGSGGAIKEVGNGEYKLGRVARDIKDKEKDLGLTYKVYAKIPVVFIVNESSGVKNLSSQHIADIYSGKITNWQDVGGSPGKIRVVRREDGDSSLEVLRESFPGFKDLTITEKSKTVLKTLEMIDLISKKEGTIGFGPLDVAINSNLSVVNVDGKSPRDDGYPSIGTMGLIYKEENNTGAIKAFIDFATSDSASEVITKAGGIQ